MRSAMPVVHLGVTCFVLAFLLPEFTVLAAQEVTVTPPESASQTLERVDSQHDSETRFNLESASGPVTSPENGLLVPAASPSATENRMDERAAQLHRWEDIVRAIIVWPVSWYRRTPPTDRMAWGGLIACTGLGLWVLLERLIRLRSRKVIPVDFTSKFINALNDGKLDCGQALDHCERNPSPAARVALAALRRMGRPTNDMERAVTLAAHVECDRLRRNVATLRRIALLAPLIGLMGTLFALSRTLEAGVPNGTAHGAIDAAQLSWVPLAAGLAAASTLTPLMVGVVIAILALVAFDGLSTRVEKLSGALERLGAETIDAIAMMASSTASRPIFLTPHSLRPRDGENRSSALDTISGTKSDNTSIQAEIDRKPMTDQAGKHRRKPRSG
jgi:biopolymer transport protein ExbB/TolQ